VARVIATSEGPSGRNSEYLFMLEEALEGLGKGSKDSHVRSLAGRVRALMGKGDGKDASLGRGEDVAGVAVEKEIGRVRSGEGGKADEEAEKTI